MLAGPLLQQLPLSGMRFSGPPCANPWSATPGGSAAAAVFVFFLSFLLSYFCDASAACLLPPCTVVALAMAARCFLFFCHVLFDASTECRPPPCLVVVYHGRAEFHCVFYLCFLHRSRTRLIRRTASASSERRYRPSHGALAVQLQKIKTATSTHIKHRV